MHDVVLHATKDVVQKSKYISMNSPPLTIRFGYLFMFMWWKNKKTFPILLNLQRVVDGSTINNLTSLVIQNLVEYGGLTLLGNWFTLAQMGLQVFMVLKMVFPFNSCINMLHLWMVSTTCFITPTWLFKAWTCWVWFLKLNLCLLPSIIIFLIVLRGILRPTSLLSFWKVKVTKSWRT